MAIRLSGMVSGMDTESLVSALVSSYKLKKDNLVKAQTKLSWKQEKWKKKGEPYDSVMAVKPLDVQMIPLEDFSLWHRTVIHIVVVFSLLLSSRMIICEA